MKEIGNFMTYTIVYTSKTGNTALLAEKIRRSLAETANKCLYFGEPSPEAAQADLIFVGFWTDRGTCGDEISAFLKTLENKSVFLFGTAGFGGAPSFFDKILQRVCENLEKSNTILGSYICQGKMPISIRARYEMMTITDPDRIKPMIENFDRALSHPDSADLERLGDMVTKIVSE